MTSQDPNIPGARELFDRASARVDAGNAHRLRRARQAALEAQPRTGLALGLVPFGAAAAAVLALGVAWWLPANPVTTPDSSAVAATDAEIDTLMTEEDPELYAWLADAPVATRGGAPR